jgi:dTDP-glucose pyrophosphorylase/predicted transcriptional regulator
MKLNKSNNFLKSEKLKKNLIINKKNSIRDAIIKLNKSGAQIIFILDDNKRYIGTITDGDIRRGFIKGKNMNSKVEEIAQKNSLTTFENINREESLRIMRENKISHLPVVNKNKILLGVHFQEKLLSIEEYEKSENVFIFAGGFGKRLRPHTFATPKPMLLLKNKPILEHIINRFKLQGYKNFIIATHYLGNKITNYFNKGKKLGVKIRYIKEKSPLGTAGSLASIGKLTSNPIIVTNGDVLADFDIEEMVSFHKKNKAFATMAVKNYEVKNPFGVIETKGINILDFKEKPIKQEYINAGIYIFDKKINKIISNRKKMDMQELFLQLKKKKLKIIVYPIHENWIDIGRFKEYNKTKKKKNLFNKK